MLKRFLKFLADNLVSDEEWKGRKGEKHTETHLQLINLFGKKGRILRNVYLPKDNGETSEVDVVYITQKGIYVIESKFYSGWIFGNEKDTNWTVSYPNGEKRRFYNPILQNKTHIKWMRRFLGENIPLFSVIVFSEKCTLKKVTVDSDDVKVVQQIELVEAVCSIWNKSPDVLSESKINEIYNRLQALTNVDNAVKKAHINNIKREHDPVNKTTPLQSDGGNTCPRCGGLLVLRTAKRGAREGQQFYGCSSYPRCRYTRNI